MPKTGNKRPALLATESKQVSRDPNFRVQSLYKMIERDARNAWGALQRYIFASVATIEHSDTILLSTLQFARILSKLFPAFITLKLIDRLNLKR